MIGASGPSTVKRRSCAASSPSPSSLPMRQSQNESLPPQNDEPAQNDGIAAPQQCVQPAAEKLSGGQAPLRDALAQDDIAASARRVQPPRFDHSMALEFYNAIKPNGLVLGYTNGRPVADANQFEQIAKEADGRSEHFFFAVATLKPEWSDPNTHDKGSVTTPSKNKAINMPDRQQKPHP